MNVITAAEMRAIEKRAEAGGLTIPTLIERAGMALAQEAGRTQGRIIILAGPGHNGDDGVVAARLLVAGGRDVALYTVGRTGPGGAVSIAAESDADRSRLRSLLRDASVVIDALLGTGQNRRVEGPMAAIVETANAAGRPVSRIAADVPTGVNADTGAILGTAFRADATVAMGYAKVGDVIWPGAGHAGRLAVADLGLPEPEHVAVVAPGPRQVAGLLPGRPADGNKGTFGRVLIIAGSRPFVGAPALASLAALRAGAGLAQVALPGSIQIAVAAHALEPIFLPLPEEDGSLSPHAAKPLHDALAAARSVVVGPGLGLTDGTVSLLRDLLPVLATRPTVVDADALNALPRMEGWWQRLGPAVLTPHPGEMSRLTGLPIADIQSDRLGVARRFARRWGTVVVLKGAGTIVAGADERVAVIRTGGPNLATGGTGDVLSGIIGGLLAQGLMPWEGAVAGAYVHGAAGDEVARRLGAAGTLAGDLLPAIPLTRKMLENAEKEL